MKKELQGNKRCALYARVSVESVFTKKESISNQVDYLVKYAKKHSFVLKKFTVMMDIVVQQWIDQHFKKC